MSGAFCRHMHPALFWTNEIKGRNENRWSNPLIWKVHITENDFILSQTQQTRQQSGCALVISCAAWIKAKQLRANIQRRVWINPTCKQRGMDFRMTQPSEGLKKKHDFKRRQAGGWSFWAIGACGTRGRRHSTIPSLKGEHLREMGLAGATGQELCPARWALTHPPRCLASSPSSFNRR